MTRRRWQPPLKIVMKVQMNCQKCRKKAMRISACVDGVMMVSLENGNKDQLVVTGAGVDPLLMIRKMWEKVGPAYLISVGTLEPKAEGEAPTDVVSVEDVKPKPKPKAEGEATQKIRNPINAHALALSIAHVPPAPQRDEVPEEEAAP